MSNSELMTIDDIAEMHKCSREHARDMVVKMPGFPEEAPTSRPRHKLWIRAEVKAFVTRRPARIPHKTLQAA